MLWVAITGESGEVIPFADGLAPERADFGWKAERRLEELGQESTEAARQQIIAFARGRLHRRTAAQAPQTAANYDAETDPAPTDR